MNKSRTEAFSDGVLAVAITLLALDFHIDPGRGPLYRQLGMLWPEFAAYAVSFYVIGVIWVTHHGLFGLLRAVDRVLLFENLLLLMFVSTLPFTTSVLADYVGNSDGNARTAVVLYGASEIGMALTFTAMFAHTINHRLMINPVNRRVGRRAIRRFGLGTIGYPASTIAGLLWPPLLLIGIGALTTYYMFEQTPILSRADARPAELPGDEKDGANSDTG